MLYGRYEERGLKPNSAPDNGFKCFSDERFRPNALLMFYKSIIIQHEAALLIKMSIDREELVAL